MCCDNPSGFIPPLCIDDRLHAWLRDSRQDTTNSTTIDIDRRLANIGEAGCGPLNTGSTCPVFTIRVCDNGNRLNTLRAIRALDGLSNNLKRWTIRGKRDVDDSMRTLYLVELGPHTEH